MKQLLRALTFVGGLSLAGCAAEGRDAYAANEAQVSATSSDAGADPDDQSCVLPAFTPRGPALSAFEDAAELDAYVVSTTAGCIKIGPSPTRALNVAQRVSAPDGAGVLSADIDVRASKISRIGDVLIVSQSGLLFAIDVSVPGAPRQLDAQKLTSGDESKQGTRKLEIHIVGDLIYVVRKVDDLGGAGPVADANAMQQLAASSGQGQGARFVPPWPGLTIAAFRLRAGKLERLGEWLIESDDDRYQSETLVKVIDGQLHFYVGHDLSGKYVFDTARRVRYFHAKLPRILTPATQSQGRRERPLLEAHDVHRPLSSARTSTLHAIVRCAVDETADLSCAAKGWIGERLGQVHTSDAHTYVWTEGHVYAATRAPFAVSAHRITGTPRSERSMTEIGDTLFTAVSERSFSRATLRMWSLPRAAFDAKGEQDEGARTELTTFEEDGADLDGEVFIGSKYVASIYTFLPNLIAKRVIYDVATRAAPYTDVTAFRYYQLEALGRDRALFVGSSTEAGDRTMTLEAWRLDGEPRPIAKLVLPGTDPVWDRMRFFVRQSVDPGRTRFALPLERMTRRSAEGDAWLGLFELRQNELTLFGAPAPARSEEPPVPPPCIGVCGQTLFAVDAAYLSDRVFAQQGDVVVELGLEPLAERGRVRLVPLARTADSPRDPSRPRGSLLLK